MKNNSSAFVNQLFVFLLVTLGAGGSIGLGTVWMRHQISITANANRALAARIADLDRHVAENKTRIESAQSHDALRRLNADLQLGLVPVSDGQVAHVTDDPIQRMAARSNRGLFGEGLAPVTFQVALQH